MYGMNVSVNVDVDLLQRAEALDADQTCIRSRFLVTFYEFPTVYLLRNLLMLRHVICDSQFSPLSTKFSFCLDHRGMLLPVEITVPPVKLGNSCARDHVTFPD